MYSILTWFRVAEILAGARLALTLASPRVNYARPFFCGSFDRIYDLAFARCAPTRLIRTDMDYLAQISFALYVIHPLTDAG